MCKVFQMLELPSELEEKETYQALLLTERSLFLESAVNGSRLQLEDRRSFSALLSSALDTYEAACSEASAVGVDLVTKVGGAVGRGTAVTLHIAGICRQLGLCSVMLLLLDNFDNNR